MATPISDTVSGTRYYQAQSRLMATMPVELILNIADQAASVVDVVSLALTCKDLFSILLKFIKRLDAHSRKILITTLERGTSWVVYCPVIRKLRPFSCKENIFIYPIDYHYCQLFQPNVERHIDTVCPGRSLGVGLLETRLVRNHRLFGDTCGIPPHSLSISESKPMLFMNDYGQSRLEISREAKWVGDDLFLSYTRTLRMMGVGNTRPEIIPTESSHDLLHPKLLGKACYHCRLDGRNGFLFGILKPSLDEAGATLSNNFAYEGIGGCLFCETDWDLSISWLQDSLVFKAVTYHDLGCCSSPPDQKWRRLLKYTYRPYRGDPPRQSRYGSVRHRWMNSG